MEETRHLIGMLLGTEEDWPTAFETLVSRVGLRFEAAGCAADVRRQQKRGR